MSCFICHQVLVWHTRTELVNLKKEEKFKEQKGHNSDQGLEVWWHNLIGDGSLPLKIKRCCEGHRVQMGLITEKMQERRLFFRKVKHWRKIVKKPYFGRDWNSGISMHCDQTDVIGRSSGLLVLSSQNGVLYWRYSSLKTNRIWSFRWISSLRASSTQEWGWVTPVGAERAGISWTSITFTRY